MGKAKHQFQCQDCGCIYHQWSGKCHDCGAWNTLQEIVITAGPKPQNYAGSYDDLVLQDFDQIELSEQARFSTGLSELDRALGGGLVVGSVILLGGDPGIGKSTLLLQAVANLSSKYKVLYVTGEESLSQVVLRGKRLGITAPEIKLLSAVQLDNIIQQTQTYRPQVMVVDSIQTLCAPHISSAAGSVSQVRECAAQLVQLAKNAGIVLFIVGHVTKDGALAGPRVLEHMVDTVLYFEQKEDPRFRMLRAVKNRFGAVNELGVFVMSETGLKPVANPSAIFLARSAQPVAGSVVTVNWEGTRPLLVEVQALVDTTHSERARRLAVGVDLNRLLMMLAVLHRHGNIFTHDQDVFVNVVGGIRIAETAADLALIVAVVSSLRNLVLPQDLIILGELGLGGELRPVPNAQARLQEASKHGFRQAILPRANLPKGKFEDLTVHLGDNLAEVLQVMSSL